MTSIRAPKGAASGTARVRPMVAGRRAARARTAARPGERRAPLADVGAPSQRPDPRPRAGPRPGPAPAPASPSGPMIPGMPPVPDPANLYSETAAGRFSSAVAGALSRVYVPNVKANTVTVIDPTTLTVVETFPVGINPQHVVPSYDLTTLWVANNAEGLTTGSLTPIDPTTGKPGRPIPVDDPYNLYFTPDGRSAMVVAEALKQLDFRDPRTMALRRRSRCRTARA